MIGVCSLAVVAAGMVAVPPAATAAPARDLSPLKSTPAPRTTPELPTGDHSNPPPNPNDLPGRRPVPTGAAFDPARSVVLPAETTATKQVFANTDGSKTAVVSPRAVRFQDADGIWHDIDMSLVPAADGSLGAKAAAVPARLAADAGGAVANIETSAGTIGVRHPHSLPTPATLDKANATYKGALGGRDLTLGVTTDGVEETVVAHDAKSGPSYIDEFVLPAGVSARAGASGVEFVVAKGDVVATFGAGVAFDAASSAAPVTLRLVGTTTPKDASSVATVEVGVDGAWFSDPARAFPISIDPFITVPTNASVGIDTFGWGGAPTTNYGAATALYVGNLGTGTTTESFVRFDNLVVTPSPDVYVQESHLMLLGLGAANCAKPVNIQGIDNTLTAATTWNTRPALEGALVSSTGLGASCASVWNNFDTTSLVQRWLNGSAPNNGLRVSAADEFDPAGFKQFWSNNTANPPFLYITYDHLPGYSTPTAPGTGAVVNTATPVLAATTATDPDVGPPADTVRYWFRATPASDAESGVKVVDSGWLGATPSGTPCVTGQICYQVPVGALADGVTYSWHVWTYDGYVWRAPTGAPSSLRVQLSLGGDGPLPRDSVGPVSVNLGNGNVAMAAASPTFPTVGGPAGVSYAYNSEAAPNVGLSARYFNDPDPAHPPTSPAIMDTLLPQLVRQDPTIDHYWGTDGPGGGVGTDNFMTRWTGYVTVPSGNSPNYSGNYNLNSDHDDGIVVRLGGTLAGGKMTGGTTVLNHWADGTFNNPSEGAIAFPFVGGTPVAIQVDYHEHVGNAFATVWANGPQGLSQLLPSWLTPDPAVNSTALPEGWTLGVTGLGYTSATLGQGYVAFVDRSGASHAYTWTGSGFAPAPGEDGVAAYDANGLLTLHGGDGLTYVFDSAGRLTYATSATDDVNQSSLKYVSSAADPNHPVRLLQIVDATDSAAAPRKIVLTYKRTSTDCPPLAGYDAVPNDMLCQVAYWDGTHTDLSYSAGQLARIEDPGGSVTEAAYTAGLLTRVRTPLVYDAVHAPPPAPVVPNDDTTRVIVAYDSAPIPRATKVTLPVPNAGALLPAARPAHTYDYTVANQATVHTDYPSGQGASFEPAGFSRRVLFPPRAADGTLTLTDTNANGISATSLLDAANRPLSSDVAGRRSTMVYAIDATRSHPVGQVTDAYGAAPPACFGPDRKAVTPPCATPPAHTATTYDTAPDGVTMTQGLAATYWPNLNFGGPPALHGTVAPTTAGSMVPADPPAGLAVGAWSARLIGEVIFPTSGTYTFTLAAAGTARLYIDDNLVVGPGTSGTFIQPAGPVTRRRIRIDYAPPAGAAAQLSLHWTPPGAGDQAVPGTQLAPAYFNGTKTVTDDNAGVPARTTTTDTEGPTGLIKSVTTDPAGLNLTTSTTYEDTGDGKYRRQTLQTLPGGDTSDPTTGTASSYYAGVTHPGGVEVPAATGVANTCATDSTTVNQGAAVHFTTSPRPDPSTPAIVTESVHDLAGRIVASRRNADPWACTVYDTRGRVLTVAVPGLTDPAFGAAAATPRVVTYSYAVGGNPLVSSVSDSSGTIRTTVDLLDRVVTSLDAYGDPNGLPNSTVDHLTSRTYDQAGRLVTSDGPQGRLDSDYAGGQVTRQHVGNGGDVSPGPVWAVPSYDPTSGELTAVAYCSTSQVTGACNTAQPNGGNGTTLVVGRDANGRTTHLGWSGPGGPIVDDVVQRSQSGAMVDESIDTVDYNPSGANFSYDAAGRLTAASVPGHALTYSFDPSGGCGVAAAAGKNSNRTAATDNGGTPTTYCYDHADRLTSSTDVANVGTPTYDPHGNAVILGTQVLNYDSSGRHVRTDTTTGPSLSITYTRDAANRLIARAENGVTTARYGFAGSGDAPAFAMDATNTVTQRFVGLAGGAMVTRQTLGDVWSYPNIHGDVVATATGANSVSPAPGSKIGLTLSYDPFGQALSALPNNGPGNVDFGWLGQSQRPTDHGGTSTVIEMGARPYVPATGRFVGVDPVPSGSCNAYDYVCGDPVNSSDLGGTEKKKQAPVIDPQWYGPCVELTPYNEKLAESSFCDAYRGLVFEQKYHIAPVKPSPEFGPTYLAPIAKVTSIVTGIAGIPVAFIPGAQPVAFALEATSAVTGVIGQAADPSPCRGERVATSAAFGGLSLSGAAALVEVGQKAGGSIVEGTTLLGSNTIHPQC